MRECEAHHAGSGKYSPCRIYASEWKTQVTTWIA
jgi:hypothetical protein